MLGAIIGDTIGSIYEFNNIHTKVFPLFSKSSTFTDDSIMSMAVAKWLLTDEHHTHSSLIEIMEEYYKDFPNPMGGYGARFGVWLATPTAEKMPYNSFGNGSAMRASACGWVAKSKDEAMRLAKISAEVTHNHPEGIKGAQAVAVGVYMMRHGALKCDVADFLQNELGYTFDEDLKGLQSTYSFDETCQGTIPAAFTAFGESADFEDAIRNAISIGGDSDTVACITGAFAEAFYKVIPADIIYEMRKRLPSDWWHIIWRIKAYENHRVAPDNIDFLKSEQIFVFGSNKEGQHYGGAAAYAYKCFHAEWGVGEGITGLCYALPTMEGLDEMEEAVGRFTEHALADPDHNYLVTAIGCGIAGYTPEEVAPMFMEAASLPNVYLPQCFWDELDKFSKVV